MRTSSRSPRFVSRRLFTAACLALPLAAMTCLEPTHVDLAPDSAANAPAFTFRVGDEKVDAVREFGVYACRPSELQTPLWSIRPGDSATVARGEPLRVTYGQVPPGYVAENPAPPLQPRRCYEAAAAAAGVRAAFPGARDFYLERDGRVRALRGETAFELGIRNEQLWHRAAVQCRRGYRRARTPQDSMAVDARRYPVADTSLTCGWMLKAYPDDVRKALSSERGTAAFLGFVAAMAALVTINGALDRAIGTSH
jgi:hypothetical protein